MKAPQLRALITGPAGWVGFELCRLWLTKYGSQSVIALTGPVQHETERHRLNILRQWPVQEMPIDLRCRPILVNRIEDFDVLFHLAAYVRTEDDASDVRVNDDGTQRLIEELGERLRNKHLVFTSSISAVDTTHVKEGWMEAETACCPRTEYGRSKLRAEEIIKAESERLGFTYSILRLPIAYGPGYRPGGMFDFFREQLPKKTLGSRIPWPGRISIVDVSDAAKILAQAAVREEMRGKTFFVSSAENPHMADLARLAADCLGVNYKPLPVNKALFRLMGVAGEMLCSATFLPHSIRILGWRVSLVVNGFCCDGTELTDLLDMRYSPWRDSFHRMFELPPPMATYSVETSTVVRSSARSLLLLTAATLLCLLPFLGKAFSVDDPLFVWSAQQIARHPLNPYGFQVIWWLSSRPMALIHHNPPLASYYAAAIGAIAGWSERALHLGFLLLTLAMVLGTYRLAQRFTRSPLLAAAATLFTPGVLVSATSVMCDIMMLAFWIWAVIFWLEGLDSGKQRYLLASSLLMAAAVLTKYFGIGLLPLLFVYSIAKQRRLGTWAFYFVLPISLLAGYEFWTHALYGHGHVSNALLFSSTRIAGARYGALLYPLVCTSFIGGCTLPALTLAPLVWSRRYILIALLLEVVAIAAGWMVFGPEHQTLIVLRQHGWIVGPQLALFIAGGASVLALAAVDVWTHRNAESMLLALWVLGTFVFAAFLNWTINARSVLPLIPAAGILLARRLDALGIASAKQLRWKATAAVLISGMVSLWIAQADADWANSARRAAEIIAERPKDETGTIWFQGHWGFQYYSQLLGMRPLDFVNTTLKAGDWLAIAQAYFGQAPPQPLVASRELIEIKLRSPVMIMNREMDAGFYSFSFGVLPFAFGPAPTEQYDLFRMKAAMRPDQWAPFTPHDAPNPAATK